MEEITIPPKVVIHFTKLSIAWMMVEQVVDKLVVLVKFYPNYKLFS
jgi:hypothetical protein